MKKWLHRLEEIVDKSIPYLLVLLLTLIILELFFHEVVEHYLIWIDIADYLIILVFLIDLGFKWHRSKNIKDFLKTSWLDILAIFPFYLIFRIFEEIASLARFAESLKTTQQILHETVEVEKEATEVIAKVEKAGKVSRTRLFIRFIKPIQRIPRFLKAVPFFEHPKTFKHKKNKKKK
ncbi:ion transporter [Candidatus Woesearchaeota archaeon]|nr:ion transporter [Candidatus Woesearchaeota archaeon]